MFEMLLPLTVFSVASTVTPGPNNVMLTASGSAFGFRRSVPHMLGITVGFPLMLFTVGLGLGEIFTRYTQIHLALKYVGAAYLLYLAWRIAQSGQSDGGEADGRRPLTFLEAAAFQWVNPKAWIMAVSAIPAFTTPGGSYYAELSVISLVFAAVCVPSCIRGACSAWRSATLIRTPETARIVNFGLAALVALSVGLLFL